MEITITKDNFENEVLNSDTPVLIDFWASWCGPCQMLSPIISEIAEEYDGKIKVCKVNVDNERELSSRFKIMSIPTVVVMKNGDVSNVSVGFKSKEELMHLIFEQREKR